MFHGVMISVDRLIVNPKVNTRKKLGAQESVGDGGVWHDKLRLIYCKRGIIGGDNAHLSMCAVE
jgi:hypothetical protein